MIKGNDLKVLIIKSNTLFNFGLSKIFPSLVTVRSIPIGKPINNEKSVEKKNSSLYVYKQ